MTRDRMTMLKDWHAGNTGCIPARPAPAAPPAKAQAFVATHRYRAVKGDPVQLVMVLGDGLYDREALVRFQGQPDSYGGTRVAKSGLIALDACCCEFHDDGDGESGPHLVHRWVVGCPVHSPFDEEQPVVLRDAIGSGVGVHLFRDRGIVSVVLVDDENGIPLANTPSAEIMLSDLAQALEMLQKGEGGEAGKEDWQA